MFDWPRLTRTARNFAANSYTNRHMIKSMVARDIRGRYVGSFLGLFWSVIHPLLQLTIYYLVFSVILKVKLGEQYGDTHFVIWLLAGLLLWMFFVDVVVRSPTAILEQSNLITKMVFPAEILSLVHVIAALVTHGISMSIFLAVILMLGYDLSPKPLLLVATLLTTALLALGISWMLAALNVFLRDIGQITSVLVNAWFFLTPIVYPPDLIPAGLQSLYNLNPMVHAVEAYRTALLTPAAADMTAFAYLFLSAFIWLVCGALTFRALKPHFADVL